MATFIVSTTGDSGAGSLRDAILAANARAGADEIRFDAAVFDGEAENLIRLTGGQIEITDELAILGGPAGVTITGDANGDDVTLAGSITDVAASLAGDDRLDDNRRIFDATAALTLYDLTLTGGRTTAEWESGGAVRGTTLMLTNSTVSGNGTAGTRSGGGGVHGSYVTLTNSTVSGNTTAGTYARGGGVNGSRVTLTNSTVSGNGTAGDSAEGGGVFGYRVTLANSTVSGNGTAGDSAEGGGVSGFSSVTLTNSTVSGNTTAGTYALGGGVNGGFVTLANSIVLGNVATGAGDARDEVGFSLSLSLVGANVVGGDIFWGAADVGDVTAAEIFAEVTTVAPGVLAGVLSDNGGPTRTILIAADGPAVDAGSAVAGLTIDQRGAPRFSGAAVDLGAVEIQTTPPVGSLVVDTATDVVDANDGLTSLREAVSFANVMAGADTITFDATVFDGEASDLIRLTGGQIEITDELAIIGGPTRVTITGDGDADDLTDEFGITLLGQGFGSGDSHNSRIFDAVATVDLERLVLTGGVASDNENGGAVRSSMNLYVTDCIIKGNSVQHYGSEDYGGSGGGIYAPSIEIKSSILGNNRAGFYGKGGAVAGTVIVISDSEITNNIGGSGGGIGGNSYVSVSYVSVSSTSISENRSYYFGGGIHASKLNVQDSILTGNISRGQGGAMYVQTLYLNSSTINNNVVESYYYRGSGGGVSAKTASIFKSTIYGNSAFGSYSFGGGVRAISVDVRESTITGNHAKEGAALSASLRASLVNSLVLGNGEGASQQEVQGTLALTGGNIVGGDIFSGAADVGDVTAAGVFAATTEIAPGVFAGVLADNGGPTRTVAIRADGPAAGAADPARATATDQRGFARDKAPDLGAFEAGATGGLTLVGGPGPDRLVGSDLADRIRGRGGDDDLRGKGGDDAILGDRGRDRIRAGDGDDNVRGGAGRDRIDGGAGDDVLHGGKGHDLFVLGEGFGRDEILDFDAGPRCGQDRIDLRCLGITAAAFATEVEIAPDDGDTLVSVRGQGSVLLAGVAPAALDATDFLLA